MRERCMQTGRLEDGQPCEAQRLVWFDRGRSAITRERVVAELDALRRMLPDGWPFRLADSYCGHWHTVIEGYR